MDRSRAAALTRVTRLRQCASRRARPRTPHHRLGAPMSILRMTDLDLAGKRVLIREDLNVPIDDGRITSEQRIIASLPTLQLALEKGAAVMVTSHLGPAEGRAVERGRFARAGRRAPVGAARPRRAAGAGLGRWRRRAPGQLVLLENCRMNVGEGKDDEALSKKYAALCDVFVMDAFGTAHRAQASTHGVIRFAKQCRGRSAADGRTRCAGQGARQAGASAAGDRRRLQGRRPSSSCCRRWSARSTS